MISRQLTSRAIVALTIRIAVAWLATILVVEFGFILLIANNWPPLGQGGVALGFVLFVALATLMMLFADIIAGWIVPAQTLTFAAVDRSRVFSFALRLLGAWVIADGIQQLVQLASLKIESRILRSPAFTLDSLPWEFILARLAVFLAGFLMLFKAPWLTRCLERWQEKIGAGKDEPLLLGAADPPLRPLWETPLFAIAIRLLGIWFILASIHTLALAGAIALRNASQVGLLVPHSSEELDAWMVIGAVVRVLLAVGMISGSSWIAAWLFGKTVLFTDGRQTVTLLMDGGMVDEYFCDECGQSVPEKAAACPYCGDDFEKGKT